MNRRNVANYIGYSLTVILGLLFTFSLKSNFLLSSNFDIDSSVFMYIGNAIKEYGEVPYRDIFDHKGPLLYLINYIACLFPSNRLGLYIVETFFILINCITIYNISNMVTKRKTYSVLTVLISLLLFAKYIQGGNFCEEYALTFILLALYFFVSFIVNDIYKLPTKKIIAIGMCLGCVLLLRPNMISVWITFCVAITIYFLIEKNYKYIFKSLLLICIGVIIVSVPFIVYLLINRSLLSFLYAYFFFNIAYVGDSFVAIKYINTVLEFWTAISSFCLIVYIIALFKNKNDKRKVLLFGASLTYIIICTLMVSMSSRTYLHYAIPTIACSVVGLAYGFDMIAVFLERKFAQNRLARNISKIIVVVIIIAVFVINIGFDIYKDFNFRKKEYTEPEIVNYIKENTSNDDEILVGLNDVYIYLLTDRKASSKFIYQLPIANQDKNIWKHMVSEIGEKQPEVFVMRKDMRLVKNPFVVDCLYYFDLLVKKNVYEKIEDVKASEDYYIYKLKRTK